MVLAPFNVLCDESSWLPVVAYFVALVLEDIWFPSKVLPIVCINTLSLIMFLIKRTPLSLEVKHIEIAIFLHLVNQPGFKVLGAVSEGAVVTVLALAQVLGVLRAVL